MRNILLVKSSYEHEYINAIIDNNYIIPGMNGITIDELNTYYKLKVNNTFDTSLFVFKEISPASSYYNHKDLIIRKGNPYKNSISIIVNNNQKIIDYLLDKNINFSRLVNINNIVNESKYLQINNDFLHYEQVEQYLDKIKKNTEICIVNNSNIDFCKSNGKYMIEPIRLSNQSKILNSSVNSGDIFLIDDDLKLSKFKLLLKEIEYQNLNIVNLDYLISESR